MKALIVIDVQKDYFPDGRFELFEADKTAKRVNVLVNRFREEGNPVLFIRHLCNSPAPFFEKGTKGSELHESLCPRPEEPVILKESPNSFLNTTLQEELQKRNVTELSVCGMMTHMCVDTTVRAASDLGYSVTVYQDACTTRDLEFNGKLLPATEVNAVYMASLNGAFAKVISVE